MGFEPGRSNLENLNKDTQQIGIGIAGALIEIPDVLRLRRDEEEGMHAGHHLLWPLHSAYTSSSWTSLGGISPVNVCEKMCYVSVLSY